MNERVVNNMMVKHGYDPKRVAGGRESEKVKGPGGFRISNPS